MAVERDHIHPAHHPSFRRIIAPSSEKGVADENQEGDGYRKSVGVWRIDRTEAFPSVALQCPDVNTQLPVSRQHEIEYLEYFGYPLYWGGSDRWASDLYPAAKLFPQLLCRASEIHPISTPRPAGERPTPIFETRRNWWLEKKVLISPAWIERVSWADSKVAVKLSRETIQSGPEYIESTRSHVSTKIAFKLITGCPYIGREPNIGQSFRARELFTAPG
jgi:hypothetical protein